MKRGGRKKGPAKMSAQARNKILRKIKAKFVPERNPLGRWLSDQIDSIAYGLLAFPTRPVSKSWQYTSTVPDEHET